MHRWIGLIGITILGLALIANYYYNKTKKVREVEEVNSKVIDAGKSVKNLYHKYKK